MKKYASRIALRLSDSERQQLEKLVRERKFKNVSQAIRAALKDLVAKHGAT
ncbi:TPA: ribbon-helix-helix protein, CopG family [Candidatus Bathyarchaeota archaeon]|nr:ribbon-helix-helix protein, CopG family [Candidatus Bathyarchaeota archaeon]